MVLTNHEWRLQMRFEKLPNYRKAEIYRANYKLWKELSLDNEGYFPIFQMFKEDFLLSKISGNALKLYIYLGLHTGNKTGETWINIESMAKYFNKSPRTISNWLDELINLKLIERCQLKFNASAHTFLLPYGYDKLTNKILEDDENFDY